MLIMLGMGITLSFDDFRQVWSKRYAVLAGVVTQFLVMPLAAFGVARELSLPPDLLIGMLLVGSSAGGTDSNVITFVAKGDVALSVAMTVVSTLLAVIAMPALTWVYIGQSVPVPTQAMMASIGKIVIVPVLLGISLNTLLAARFKRARVLFPLLSVLSIVGIIGIIVAVNHDKIALAVKYFSAGVALPGALFSIWHNLSGSLLASRWSRRP